VPAGRVKVEEVYIEELVEVDESSDEVEPLEEEL